MAATASRDGNEPTTQPRRTQRDVFLDTMDSLMPCPRLYAIVEPHQPENSGAPSAGIERMLRICFFQSWFGLSDRDCEDALIDSIGLRRFARIDETREPAPDADAIAQFRRFLQSRGLAQPVAAEVNGALAANGVRVKPGAIANARILADIASSAQENRSDARAASSAAGPERQRARPNFGDAYGMQSMRLRLAPAAARNDAHDAHDARADALSRIGQAIANVQRLT